MIDIAEHFTVAAPPQAVYAVLSDPNAVVECVPGASLGAQAEDGSFLGTMTVKFSALRITFSGRVHLDLDAEQRRGTVRATGRDGQGGTKFQATAEFSVLPGADGSVSDVTATGAVELSGKLASVIENAATAVVRRMTAEFVTALSLRCASDSAVYGASDTDQPEPTAGERPAPPAVVLVHDLGATPNALRVWGEALAAAGCTVRVPRLPGHGTRWQDLDTVPAQQWLTAVTADVDALAESHDRVYLMGVGVGGTLALRAAQVRESRVTGVVAVNPLATRLLATPKWSWLRRLLGRSVPVPGQDVRKAGQPEPAYRRLGLRTLREAAALAATTTSAATTLRVPVVLGVSAVDHVVPTADADALLSVLSRHGKIECHTFAHSYHAVQLDDDAAELFAQSASLAQPEAPIQTVS